MFQSVFDHQLILADQVRVSAYQKAIREVVKNGDVVADIGAGSGILAFIAAQAGAGKVYAIEQEEIINDARQLAKTNGVDEKIDFIQGRSDRIELPEKVDVIISEILGCFGLEENVAGYLMDARKRFLKPGGKIIPAGLELSIVPVETRWFWKDHIGLWSSDYYSYDFSSVKNSSVSNVYRELFSGDMNPLSVPALVANISFYSIEKAPAVFHGQISIDKRGALHGLLGYFRAALSASVSLSTAPEDSPTHWKQTFFPLGEEVVVEEGDEMRYKLVAIPQTGGIAWQWDTHVLRKGNTVARFSHSDLKLSKADMALGRQDFRPVLSLKGIIAQRVLELCDGKRSIAEIAQILWAEYPDQYGRLKDAVQGVTNIIQSVVVL